MAKKTQVLELPTAVRDEIVEVARRAQRSVAFVVHRALVAGKGVGAPPDGPRAPLPLALDEDDPPSLPGKISAAAGARPLDDAVAAAWSAARDKFQAWLKRADEASEAERADDLDTGLRDAAAPTTPAARLAALAKSEYVRVRALVAAHPSTPSAVRAELARDADRVVRAAVR
jgi:hypothetical protein